MAEISGMTDYNLRLAIAAELGYKNRDKEEGWFVTPDGKDTICRFSLPQWVTEESLALKLLDGMAFGIELSKSGKATVHIEVGDETVSAKAESLPRAICEAWLTARRNNG